MSESLDDRRRRWALGKRCRKCRDWLLSYQDPHLMAVGVLAILPKGECCGACHWHWMRTGRLPHA